MSPLEIDQAILERCRHDWRKIAWLIADIILAAEDAPPEPDAVAAQIVHLVEAGRLEAHGDLSFWRHSEVRLPATSKSP